MIKLFAFLLFTLSSFAATDTKHVVFITGHDELSHGEHEYRAGAKLMAKKLNESGLPIKATVLEGYWPEDEKELLEADSLIVYSDGLGNHIMNGYFQMMDLWVKSGKSVGFLHKSIQVPKGHKSKMMMSWTGGYYEKYYSTDPQWECDAILNKNHEISNGVGKFKVRDEWLFNIRFDKKLKLTPILSGKPDDLARSGKYTSHQSEIPSVSKNKGREETVMWTHQGKDQGRSFVFAGGHYHENWNRKNLLKLVLNAIVWSTGLEVPEKGVSFTKVTDAELDADMSEDRADTVWQNEKSILMKASLKFSSGIITDKSPGKSVAIDIPVGNEKELTLLVLDGGNGISCDHTVWASPTLHFGESKKKLTDYKWEQVVTGWRSILIDKGLNGQDLKLNGELVTGIASHSVSVIRYKLPEGVTRFTTTAGLADSRVGGSVQFQVYLK